MLSRGSGIAGAAVGGAIGFFAAGPVGAAGAGVLGAITAQTLEDFVNRTLSNQEQIRVGATAAFAINDIKVRIEKGERPRSDGMFEQPSTEARELFEGVLIKAKNDHEQKKAYYYAKLFSNIAFDHNVSSMQGNYYLRQLESLSYLDLVLLAVYSLPRRFSLRKKPYAPGELITFDLAVILDSLFGLLRSQLLLLQKEGTKNHEIVLDPNRIRPDDVMLGGSGQILEHYASLREIPYADIKPVVEALSMAKGATFIKPSHPPHSADAPGCR